MKFMEMIRVKLLIQISVIHIYFLIVNQNLSFITNLFLFLVLELNLPDKDDLKSIGINTEKRFAF